MRIDDFHATKNFLKRLAALPARKQIKVKEALKLALTDSDNPRLRLHELKGEHLGTYSISAGGDLRIHFELVTSNGKTIASLQAVGTHSQLYR